MLSPGLDPPARLAANILFVDLQHHLFLLTTEFKLNLAPLKPGAQHALDVGTGTGIWAIDFAQEHPDIEVSSALNNRFPTYSREL